MPSVTWLLKEGRKRFYLLGSDYVFPRTANLIIKAQLKAEGGQLVGEEYTPLGHTEYSTVISKIKTTKPDVIYNTLNGDSNVAFFKQLRAAGITATDIPVMSVSIAEDELRGIGAEICEGHYAAWNYFMSMDTPENKVFVENYKARYGTDRVTDDPIEAGYFGVYLWAEAVKKAGSTEVGKAREAVRGVEFNAPEAKSPSIPPTTTPGRSCRSARSGKTGSSTWSGALESPCSPILIPTWFRIRRSWLPA